MSGQATQPRIRITILVENTARRRGLLAEHGLSFWVEVGQRRILFDTGQGMALRPNAERLGIDLALADTVVLSHGHYDHTGGLHQELACFRGAVVYAHLTAFRDRFVQRDDGSADGVGSLVPSAEALRSHVAQLVQTRRRPRSLGEGVWITGEIPRIHAYEDVGGAFFLDSACTTPDPIVDDLAMYIESRAGLVVLLGCAHAGVVNTLTHIAEISGGKPVLAVMGGMHLLSASPERLERTFKAIEQYGPHLLVPLHCTGPKAMRALAARFSESYRDGHVGLRLDFD